MSDDSLTAQRLRELFHYDPDTGIFTRKVKTWPGSYIGEVVGSRHSQGYVQLKVEGKMRKAHRLAWLYMMGQWPCNEIDHRDRCRSNNAWSNLRDVLPSANQHNRAPQINNSSGYLGVTRSKNPAKPWRAQISLNGKRFNLGDFESAHLAFDAYQAAKLQCDFNK